MMALNDILLSRAVRASPDTEKQNVCKNPAIHESPANAINIPDHTLPSSSAVRESANALGNKNSNKNSMHNYVESNLGVKKSDMQVPRVPFL